MGTRLSAPPLATKHKRALASGIHSQNNPEPKRAKWCLDEAELGSRMRVQGPVAPKLTSKFWLMLGVGGHECKDWFYDFMVSDPENQQEPSN